MVTPITPEAKLDVYFSVAYKNAAQITHIKTNRFIRMRPLDSIAQKTAVAIITADLLPRNSRNRAASYEAPFKLILSHHTIFI